MSAPSPKRRASSKNGTGGPGIICPPLVVTGVVMLRERR
jgi:hypothetical protein